MKHRQNPGDPCCAKPDLEDVEIYWYLRLFGHRGPIFRKCHRCGSESTLASTPLPTNSHRKKRVFFSITAKR